MNSSNKVEETEQEKELALRMSDEWAIYNNELAPIEDQVIDSALASNDDEVYAEIGSASNLASNSSLSELTSSTSRNLNASGINPNSGSYKSTLNDMAEMSGSSAINVASNSQLAGVQRHVNKLENVVSMGQGEAQESTKTLADLATNAQREANHQNNLNQQRANDNLGAVGGIAGAYASHSNSLSSNKSDQENGGG